MGSIADKMNYLLETKKGIREAIAAKGVSISDGDTFRSYADKIASIEAGGGGISHTVILPHDVNYLDCDGTILYSYSAEDFLTLTTHPELPTREGLICQGWNFSLAAAQTNVSQNKLLNIGATYITDSGDTRLYIRIIGKHRSDISICFAQTLSEGVVIDWGDGSNTEKSDAIGICKLTHHYENDGYYIIRMIPQGDCQITLGGGTSDDSMIGPSTMQSNMLYKCEVGKNVTSLDDYAFYVCLSLGCITLPENVASVLTHCFESCYSLKGIVIPNGMTVLGNHSLRDCSALDSIAISESVKTLGTYALYTDRSLQNVTLANITSLGGYSIMGCSSLTRLIIPSTITTISAQTFNNCTRVSYYDFSHHTTVPKLAATSAFNGMPSDTKIIVPDDLYDTWIAATNWSTIGDNIVRLSDYNN